MNQTPKSPSILDKLLGTLSGKGAGELLNEVVTPQTAQAPQTSEPAPPPPPSIQKAMERFQSSEIANWVFEGNPDLVATAFDGMTPQQINAFQKLMTLTNQATAAVSYDAALQEAGKSTSSALEAFRSTLPKLMNEESVGDALRSTAIANNPALAGVAKQVALGLKDKFPKLTPAEIAQATEELLHRGLQEAAPKVEAAPAEDPWHGLFDAGEPPPTQPTEPAPQQAQALQ